MKKLSLLFLTFLLVLTSAVMPVNAQQARSYRGPIISPINAVYNTARRGDVITGTVQFTNDLEQDYTLNMDVTKQDFTLSDYEHLVLDESPKYPRTASLSSWITVDKQKFAVAKGETVELNYTIQVPVDAEYGGKYATIAFERNKQSDDPESQVAIQIRLQFPILLNVEGNKQEKLDVIDFKTDKSFYEDANVAFSTVVKNSGNVHVAPFGDIKVEGGWFGAGQTIEFNPGYKEDYGYILPDKNVTRKFNTEWKTGDIKFGPYKATLIMQYGTDNAITTVTANTSFWIVPWKLILTILGVLVLIVAVLVAKNKLQNASKKKKSSAKKEAE
ncbi:MAG: hypothetical protein WCJ19_03790 [bacterium]